MSRSASRWDELQERWVAGESLSTAEQRERLEHVARDLNARREFELYQRAQRWVGESSSAETDAVARLAAQVLERAALLRVGGLQLVSEEALERGAPAPVFRRDYGYAKWLAAAAAAALLVIGTQVLRGESEPGGVAGNAVSAPRASCRLLSSTGDVKATASGHGQSAGLLVEGQRLSTAAGTACLGIDDAIRVCVPNDSEIVLASLDPRDIRIRVERGGSVAALAARPTGSVFSLTAGNVVATARGTIFAVERRSGAQSAEVTVLEGRVEVSAAGAQALVPALTQLTLGDGQPVRREAVDASKQRRWLGWLGADPAAAAAAAVPAPAMTSSVPPSGVDRSAAAAPSSLDRATPAPARSRDELLAAARREAGLGNARAARTLYRELLTRYPGPGTASIEVVLGNLEADLNAPERALKHFDAYLRRGGPLAPEALHGKVRALRALGRKAEERATIQGYLARYPNGFQAPSLRNRLKELE